MPSFRAWPVLQKGKEGRSRKADGVSYRQHYLGGVKEQHFLIGKFNWTSRGPRTPSRLQIKIGYAVCF